MTINQPIWPTTLTELPNRELTGTKGRVITGTYGKQYVINDDGEEVKVSDLQPKVIRGRGRPKKDADTIMEFDKSLLNLFSTWGK